MRVESQNQNDDDSLRQPLNGLSPVIAAAAHELKAPLLSINFMSQILSDKSLDLSDRQIEDYLIRLQQISQRTLRLVQHLTLSYKLESQSAFSFNLEPVNLREVCEAAMHEMSPYAVSRGQDMAIDLSRRPAIALANRDVAFDVMVNLLDNAINHGDSNSIINVKPSCHSDSVRLSVQNDSNNTFVTKQEVNLIKDNIGQTVQPFKRQAGNSGLGLYIVNQLVEAMGGTLGMGRVNNRQSFYVSLIRSQQLRLL